MDIEVKIVGLIVAKGISYHLAITRNGLFCVIHPNETDYLDEVGVFQEYATFFHCVSCCLSAFHGTPLSYTHDPFNPDWHAHNLPDQQQLSGTSSSSPFSAWAAWKVSEQPDQPDQQSKSAKSPPPNLHPTPDSINIEITESILHSQEDPYVIPSEDTQPKFSLN